MLYRNASNELSNIANSGSDNTIKVVVFVQEKPCLQWVPRVSYSMNRVMTRILWQTMRTANFIDFFPSLSLSLLLYLIFFYPVPGSKAVKDHRTPIGILFSAFCDFSWVLRSRELPHEATIGDLMLQIVAVSYLRAF